MVLSKTKLNRFLKSGLVLIVMLLASACGKNGSNGAGYYPIAPAPNGSMPYYPYQGGGYPYNGYNGGYPYNGYTGGNGYPYAGTYPYGGTGGYPYGSPYGYAAPNAGYPTYFNPQMPSGFPQSYYPFLPIDNYYRNNPSFGPQYWNTLWTQWTRQATTWGVSPYDFTTFWTRYCPQIWTSGQQKSVYIHFNQTFYSWAQPGVVIPASASPQTFWSNYIGIFY